MAKKQLKANRTDPIKIIGAKLGFEVTGDKQFSPYLSQVARTFLLATAKGSTVRRGTHQVGTFFSFAGRSLTRLTVVAQSTSPLHPAAR